MGFFLLPPDLGEVKGERYAPMAYLSFMPSMVHLHRLLRAESLINILNLFIPPETRCLASHQCDTCVLIESEGLFQPLLRMLREDRAFFREEKCVLHF